MKHSNYEHFQEDALPEGFLRALALTEEGLTEITQRLSAPDLSIQELKGLHDEAAAWQQLWAEHRLRTERTLGMLLRDLKGSTR